MSKPVDAYVQRAASRFAVQLQAVVETYQAEGRAPVALLGEPEDLADRAVAAQAPARSPWDVLAGPFLRSEGVQARLGISRQAVSAKAARRRLLRVFTAERVALFPVWQFDCGHLVTGLGEVLAQFGEEEVDGWTLAGWLRSQDAELGGVPLDLLVTGDPASVLIAARAAAAVLAA